MYSYSPCSKRITLLALQSRAARHWSTSARSYALAVPFGDVANLTAMKLECRKAQLLSARAHALFRDHCSGHECP